jgi:hypothetical protein
MERTNPTILAADECMLDLLINGRVDSRPEQGQSRAGGFGLPSFDRL